MTLRYRTLCSLCGAIVLASLAFIVYSFRQRSIEPVTDTSLEQIDPQHPCGAVCIVVVSELLGRPVKLERVKQAVHADGLGRISMAELQYGLRSQGFNAVGVKLNFDVLRNLDGIPLVLYVNRSHFLVILPTGTGSVVVLDPPHPVECLPSSALRSRWGGEAILVQKTPEDLRRVTASLGIPESNVANYP